MFQPELFQDLSTEHKPKRFQLPSLAGRFLRVKVAYEDLIFFSLAILLVLLGGFCLGVERGKQLVRPLAVLQTSGVATAGEGLPLEKAQGQARPLPKIPVGASPVPSLPVVEAGVPTGLQEHPPYVIQLATYVREESAQEEARRLAKSGTRAQVVKQGRYFELRAVGYRSRLEAREALSRLKRGYRDAFIKRSSVG